MITRLRTSKEAKERLESLNRVLRFSSNAVILRFAIAKSIMVPDDVLEDKDSRASNSSGFEITRATLFGENEPIYKYCMGIKAADSDERFFPTLTSAHIERGLKLLEREYKLSGSKEKFLKACIQKMED